MLKKIFTKHQKTKLFICIVGCIFVISGCGLKSDPEPPVTSAIN